MLPLSHGRCASLVASFFAALGLAASAGANWLGSEPYFISLLVDGNVIEPVESVDDIAPGDVVYGVTIGDAYAANPVAGEVTVVGEGSGLDRAAIGGWHVDYGTGSVQSTFGTGGFVVGEGVGANDSSGVLHVLNSDIEDGDVRVYKGTVTVDAGSRVGYVEVYADGSAYVTLGSRIGGLWTHTDAYTIVQESVVSTIGSCPNRGTVIIEDSVMHCGSLQVEFGGDVDIHPALGQISRLEVGNLLTVNAASLHVSSTVVETGSIFVSGDDSNLDVVASDWENANGLRISSNAAGSTQMTVSSGSQYHDGGTVRISGVGDTQHLRVTGAGTEFEVDGDLRVGEYPIGNNTYPYFGNATVANGATVIVHGELAIRPDGVLNLESGSTIYATSLANEGTIHENGGTLVLPEAGGAISALGAIAAIAALARRREEAQSAC